MKYLHIRSATAYINQIREKAINAYLFHKPITFLLFAYQVIIYSQLIYHFN